MVDCPRCLGKGNVEQNDIMRLKKELIWAPGKCAYCNGIGKVPPGRIEKLGADTEYLTTDLPSWERHKLINGDSEALKRAEDFKEAVAETIKEIEHLYYIENQEPEEIAGYLFRKQRKYMYSDAEKQKMIAAVEKVIKSKWKG